MAHLDTSLMNFKCLFWQLPVGLQFTACDTIGKKIRNFECAYRLHVIQMYSTKTNALDSFRGDFTSVNPFLIMCNRKLLFLFSLQKREKVTFSVCKHWFDHVIRFPFNSPARLLTITKSKKKRARQCASHKQKIQHLDAFTTTFRSKAEKLKVAFKNYQNNLHWQHLNTLTETNI